MRRAGAWVGAVAVRGRSLILVCVLLSIAAAPSPALAYSVPSGLTPGDFSAICPPRPADLSAGVTPPFVAAGSGTIGAGNPSSFSVSGSGNGGPGSVTAEITATSAAGFVVELELKAANASGVYSTIDSWTLPASTGPSATTQSFPLPDVPAGPLKLYAFAVGSASASVYIDVTAGDPSGSENTLAQEIADSCYRGEQLASSQHSDLSGIDADVQATKAAVNGLLGGGANSINGAGGATLSTLDGDIGSMSGGTSLYVLHNDLVTLDTDLRNTAATSDAQTHVVELSSADRQLSADVGGQLDGDLWVLIGALVGSLLFIEALRKLWP